MTWPAVVRRMQNATRFCAPEPTISEILSDSIVIAVMEADRVDRRKLEALLQSLARRPRDES